jgi:hypothetical protein
MTNLQPAFIQVVQGAPEFRGVPAVVSIGAFLIIGLFV